MRSEGYCTCFVCLCLSPLILALQGSSRLISDANGSSTTRARKSYVAILLKLWRLRYMALKQATKPYLPPQTATDSDSVEHWQFYDGEARVLEL